MCCRTSTILSREHNPFGRNFIHLLLFLAIVCTTCNIIVFGFAHTHTSSCASCIFTPDGERLILSAACNLWIFCAHWKYQCLLCILYSVLFLSFVSIFCAHICRPYVPYSRQKCVCICWFALTKRYGAVMCRRSRTERHFVNNWLECVKCEKMNKFLN